MLLSLWGKNSYVIYIPFKKMFVQDMYFQKARLTVVFKVNFVDKLQSYIPKALPNA